MGVLGRVACLAAAVLLVMPAASADGETRGRIGPNFPVSGPAAGESDSVPEAAFDPGSNTYLVVWVDGRDAGTRGSDIYGQRVSAAGVRLGSNFRISGGGAVAQDLSPDVAFNPVSGEFLVVWSDGRDFPTRGDDVYGQRISAAGARLGPNFRISGGAATLNEETPRVAVDTTTGRYLVVFGDLRNHPAHGRDVYGQLVTKQGARLGTNFLISGGGAVGNEGLVDVAFGSGPGQFLVVWEDERAAQTTGTTRNGFVHDVYGQRVSPAGARLGSNFEISGPAADGSESRPSVAYHAGSNSYLVVWQDERTGATCGSEIYGQRVSAAGARLGPNFPVGGPAMTGDGQDPAVAVSNGTYLVTWAAGGYAEIVAQKVTGAGARLGPTFDVTGPGVSITGAYMPAVAGDPTQSRWLVLWQDFRTFTPTKADIYGQRVN